MAESSRRIKNLRKSLKLTQRDFGRLLGLSHQAISDIERGVKKPSKTTVEFLRFRYGEKFGEKPTQPPPEKKIPGKPEEAPSPTDLTPKYISSLESQVAVLKENNELLHKLLAAREVQFHDARVSLEEHSPPPGTPERRVVNIELSRILSRMNGLRGSS
jgi:transcriptional regulator with XRE-family HTH domain